jgi:hypothetical protein
MVLVRVQVEQVYHHQYQVHQRSMLAEVEAVQMVGHLQMVVQVVEVMVVHPVETQE